MTARSWRDFRTGNAPPDDCDNSDNSDKWGPETPQSRAIVPSVPFVTGLPAPIEAGLALLSEVAAPRLCQPDRWPLVVADAVRLASEGWALSAFKLGWSALDLFGAVTDADGDPAADGLAVKLAGRKVLAICSSFATVANGPAGRAYLYRGPNEGALLLWALGRGR